VTLLDPAGPAEVFKAANRFGADYRTVLLSATGEDVASNLVFGLAVDGAVSVERAPDTYVVAGSDRYPPTPAPRTCGNTCTSAR
jgi:transcriptional regulator GlxA family with amidase domain